jgi:predicted nucleic acid-binding protein
MVLETAVNGNANAIVTFNHRDFEEASRNFNCAVILPGAALRQIRRSNP